MSSFFRSSYAEPGDEAAPSAAEVPADVTQRHEDPHLRPEHGPDAGVQPAPVPLLDAPRLPPHSPRLRQESLDRLPAQPPRVLRHVPDDAEAAGGDGVEGAGAPQQPGAGEERQTDGREPVGRVQRQRVLPGRHHKVQPGVRGSGRK